MKFGRVRLPARRYVFQSLVAVLCSSLIAPGDAAWAAALLQDAPAAQGQAQADATLSPQELDSLVAPIALYPDELLSQALVASTYPLEIVQLQQWLQANKNLKGKELSDAAMKQNWDASVQAMAVLPDLVKQLSENIKWTTDLGNAFLAQQKDVMDAVQRMRSKAQGNGNLKSTEQQKVETKVVENKQVIVIEPSSPDVIYVPSYNPTVVYGAAPYPYPPITYPPPGYYAAGAAISFGVGMMVGAAFSGGWGWGCGWGGNNNVYINNNNNFVRNTNVQGGNRVNGGNSNWQHNPQHRGGAPYSNRATADRFGGTTRGSSLQNRQANARQNLGGGNRGNAGNLDRGGNRNSGLGGGMDRGGNRGSGPSAGNMDRGGGAGGFGGGNSGGLGGGDRVGNRSVPSSSSRGGGGAFGGGSGGAARASSSRGASSVGGGGRGGGGRGGGGRRR